MAKASPRDGGQQATDRAAWWNQNRGHAAPLLRRHSKRAELLSSSCITRTTPYTQHLAPNCAFMPKQVHSTRRPDALLAVWRATVWCDCDSSTCRCQRRVKSPPATQSCRMPKHITQSDHLGLLKVRAAARQGLVDARKNSVTLRIQPSNTVFLGKPAAPPPAQSICARIPCRAPALFFLQQAARRSI